EQFCRSALCRLRRQSSGVFGRRRRGFDELGRQRVWRRDVLRRVFYTIKCRLFRILRRQPGVIWPSASRNVVSVGGTSLSRDPMTGAFKGELAWQSGGGGPSIYEPLPSF